MLRKQRYVSYVLLFSILLYKTFAINYVSRNYKKIIHELVHKQIGHDDNYPVVHAFVHKKVKQEWSNLILNTYSRRIPIVLFQNDHNVVKFNSSNRIKFHHVIGIFENVEDVDLVKWKLTVGELWNPRSAFVMWIVGNILYDKIHYDIENFKNIQGMSNCLKRQYTAYVSAHSTQKLFQEFWVSNSANVVMFAFNEISKDFDLLSFDPFVPTKNDKRGMVYNLKSNEKLFHDKFVDLHGYPISISLFEKPPYVHLIKNNTVMKEGEDVKFVRNLKKKMNFTIILKSDASNAANYETVLPNGEHVGLIGDILLNRSEMLGNSRYIDVIFDRELEPLYPYDTGTYYAVVPRLPAFSSFHIIGHNWISYKTLMSLMPVPFLTLYLYLRKERYSILTTWNLMLHQQFLKMGTRNYDRIVRFTWIVFAMLITCGFESRLIKMLTSPSLPSDIDTLKELSESNLTLMVGDKMFEPINKSSLLVMKNLARNTKTNFNFSICLNTLLNHGTAACGSDKLSALLALTTLTDIKGKYRPHLMKEELGNFWMTYIVKKDLPFLPKFNLILKRLVESGLKAKATKDSMNMIKTLFMKKRLQPKNITIQIQHLKITFILCFCGITLSFLVFLFEIYNGRRHRDGKLRNCIWRKFINSLSRLQRVIGELF